jgi:hypothetical protein
MDVLEEHSVEVLLDVPTMENNCLLLLDVEVDSGVADAISEEFLYATHGNCVKHLHKVTFADVGSFLPHFPFLDEDGIAIPLFVKLETLGKFSLDLHGRRHHRDLR